MAALDDASELDKLAELRDRGVLTQSEFALQEAKIHGGSVAGASPGSGSAAAGSQPTAHEPPKRRRRMAERADFTAVLALLSAIVFWPAGSILGHLARREARQTSAEGGRLALVALIIGYIGGAFTVIVIIVAVSR